MACYYLLRLAELFIQFFYIFRSGRKWWSIQMRDTFGWISASGGRERGSQKSLEKIAWLHSWAACYVWGLEIWHRLEHLFYHSRKVPHTLDDLNQTKSGKFLQDTLLDTERSPLNNLSLLLSLIPSASVALKGCNFSKRFTLPQNRKCPENIPRGT